MDLYYTQVQAFIDNYPRWSKRPLSTFVYTVSMAVLSLMASRKVRMYVTPRLLGCSVIHAVSTMPRLPESWERLYWSETGEYPLKRLCSCIQTPNPEDVLFFAPKLQPYLDDIDPTILVESNPHTPEEIDIVIHSIAYDNLRRVIECDDFPTIHVQSMLLWKRFKEAISTENAHLVHVTICLIPSADPQTMPEECILLDIYPLDPIRTIPSQHHRRTQSLDPVLLKCKK